MFSELHLFILWSNGRSRENEIISDLREKFELLEVQEITWSENKFVENLRRFYGSNFYPKSIDVQRRGINPFILITVLDHNPRYDIAMTSSGHSRVNINILEAKNKYRQWVDNEFSIHSTVSIKETKHDLCLLLGKSYTDYLKEFNKSNAGTGIIKKLIQDPIGAHGWKNIEEVFYILNDCANYTILRDFEASPSELGRTSDIDILVDDVSLERLPYILNAKSEADDTPGTYMCNVKVGKQLIPFHLHSFSYLSPKWVMNILETKELNNHNLFVPSLENQFFSLYYQLIHWKLILKDKYKKVLSGIYAKLFADFEANTNSFDSYIYLLKQYLLTKEYFPEVPSYVRQNPLELLDVVIKNIQNIGLHSIKPYKIHLWKPGRGVKFFTALDGGNQQVLVKYFGRQGIPKKEYEILSYLNNSTEIKVPNPIFHCSMRAGHQFLVTEFLEAQSISEFDVPSLDDTFKAKIIKQIVGAIAYISSKGLIHRDIDPSNILVDKKANVYIIDFEYMIDTQNLIVQDAADHIDSLPALYNLGAPNNLDVLTWNDAHSAIKIIESFEKDFKEKYPDYYKSLAQIKNNKKCTYKINKCTIPFVKKKIKYKLAGILKLINFYFLPIVRKINS